MKVVIQEALMLLNECCRDTEPGRDDAENGSSRSRSRAAALKFIEAVSHTRPLSRPKYINVTFASQQHRC